jgi:hypothetical protein
MINALYTNKEALKLWAYDPKTQMRNTSIKESIQNNEFWNGLEDLKTATQPIHEAQKASESNNSTLGYVLERWKQLKNKLDTGAKYPRLGPFLAPGGTFEQWKETQILPVHYVAYCLDPRHVLEPVSTEERKIVLKWLISKMDPDPNIRTKITNSFWYFKGRKGSFQPNDICWASKEEPLVFWISQASSHPELSTLAERIFETPANSVASERAFSCMGLIGNKLRNRLSPEKVSKCYEAS